MAFIGLKTPHETARLLTSIEVPGDAVSMDESHITVLYLGKDVPIEVLAKAMLATYAVTSRTRPFTVRTSTLTCFPKNDDGVPVICRVDSDPLHDLQAKIRASFDQNGVPYSAKYPEYKPHVTLSYAEDEVAEQRIPTIEWGAHELVLWGGDSGDRRLIVTFPFSIDPNQEIAQRVAQRFASSGRGPLGKFEGVRP